MAGQHATEKFLQQLAGVVGVVAAMCVGDAQEAIVRQLVTSRLRFSWLVLVGGFVVDRLQEPLGKDGKTTAFALEIFTVSVASNDEFFLFCFFPADSLSSLTDSSGPSPSEPGQEYKNRFNEPEVLALATRDPGLDQEELKASGLR